MDHGMGMSWLVLQSFHQTPLFLDFLIQHRYLLMKYEHSSKPQKKKNNNIASKYIILVTHFRVYIIWSLNIPWLGCWYESVCLFIF